MQHPIVKRYVGNPILTPPEVPHPVATVPNAGVTHHNGKYIMLSRSHRANGRSILGLAESDDGSRFTPHPEPFMTPATDGVFATMSGPVYRLGVALHDLNDPSRILGVSDRWMLQPEDPWDVTGYVPNVVSSCGAVPERDGTVRIYWGGADNVMCAGAANIADLVELCLTDPRPAIWSSSASGAGASSIPGNGVSSSRSTATLIPSSCFARSAAR